MKKKTAVTVYLLSICLVGIASFGQTKHGVVLRIHPIYPIFLNIKKALVDQ